jgi:Dolichyl-phosphate-mannose-protein mannosyltransferase
MNEHSISAATTPAKPSALPAAEPRLHAAVATRVLRAHWVLLLVLAAFALATVVVPTMTPIAISDDWTYARSAQILLSEGRLTVFPVVVATAVAPIAWGALFGLFFGPTLGAFRLSTVVITVLAALALYALCCDLGVSRHRSAFGVATWLFNPLVFVLAFSFMTDPHFAALLIITLWLFARSLGPTEINRRSFVAGSAMAALTFLARQQGALIVPAVIVYLLMSRRLRFDRASLILLAQLVAIPLVVMAGYYAWLFSGPNMDAAQTGFLREVEERGRDGTWWLVRWLTVFQLVYLGFFTLPIIVAAIPALRGLVRRMRAPGWLLFVLWAASAIAGVGVLYSRGELMPYIPQFFGSSGLGPPDLVGGRPIVLDLDQRTILTAVCLLATLLLALVAGRAISAPVSVERSRAALILSIGLGQVVGVFPPSYHFLGWSAGSLDRYLEPLAPIAIVLALWGLRERPLTLSAGWIVAAALALFAVAGTRDELVFMRAVWSLADEALAAGVPKDRLDAGASWDGYVLFEYGQANHIEARTKDGPWWTNLFGPATDSTYVVASQPISGYDVIAARPYSAWLSRDPTEIFLLRRQGEPRLP